MMSAVNVHDPKVPKAKDFDLSKLEKKLEEVHNNEAPVISKEPEAPRKILKYQPLPKEKVEVATAKETTPTPASPAASAASAAIPATTQATQAEPQAPEQKSKITDSKLAPAPAVSQAIAPASAPTPPVAAIPTPSISPAKPATPSPAPAPAAAAPKAPMAPPSQESAKPPLLSKSPLAPKEISKAAPEPKQAPAAEAAQDVAQAKVVVKSIQFKGNNSLSTRELNLTVAHYIGQEMSYEDLLAVGVAIERYYNKQNRLARVILPPQDLSDGNLQLNVIESVVSKVEVEQALETMPKTQDYILAAIEARQKKGDVLDSKAIERGLAVANEVPGVSVTGSLKEGELDGETELILKMYKNQSRQAEFLADNYGSRSTGAERAMVSANFFNPRGIADLLNLTAIHTRGSEYARMAYSLPVGFDGWRMGANLSAMTYEVVAGVVGMVGATGKAFTQGLDWAYPLLRSTEENISLLFNVDTKKYLNISAQGIELSNYKMDTAAGQVSGTIRDIESGTNLNYSGQLTFGRLNLDGSLSQITDASGAKTEGSFGKLRLTASVQKAINEALSFLGNFVFQRASRNLDSAEKMQLGGATGIRAYPTGEGSGSEGEILSFELRQALSESVNVAAFYDWGQIHQQHDPNYPGGPTNNSYILKGVGLSTTYVDSSGIQLKGIWSRRLGNNPNPTQLGTDQDGTYDRNRYWLQLSVPF